MRRHDVLSKSCMMVDHDTEMSSGEWSNPINIRSDIFQQSKNPLNEWYHRYNPLFRIFFCWVNPLLWYGSRHTLQHEDLYVHPTEADSKYLLKKFKRYWKIETTKHRQGGNAYLWLAVLKCIWWPLLINGVLSTAKNFLQIPVALFIGTIVDYFCIDSPSLSDTRTAYLNALGITLITIVYVVIVVITILNGYKLGMLARIICTTALYEKVLSLSQYTVSNLTIGHIVNLASNDVHRFDLYAKIFPPKISQNLAAITIILQLIVPNVMLYSYYIFSCPLSLVLITYLLYNEVGGVSFIAIVMVLLQMPLLIFLSKLLSSLRLKAAKVTDERVKVMNEVITGIRVIKMYGWENAFHRLVSTIRQFEMSFILKSSVIRAINISLFLSSLPTIMFVMFSVHAALGGEVTKRKVFVTLSLLSVLNIYFNLMVVGFADVSEASVALKRIKRFLLIDDNINTAVCCQDELKQQSPGPGSAQVSQTSSCQIISSYSSVSVCNLCSSWNGTKDKLSLTNVSFVINQENPLMAVVGTVGAGKSTLLQCLLGELLPVSGDINMNGIVAYAGQEPWIFSASIRDNILFGQPFYPEWYNTVIDVCALDKDIDILPNGDLTLVGERGVTLSGGQKARVSLARAVYRKAGIYLLDDPLSAVDAAVSRHIFDNCIRGILRESSIVVLVTHQLQYVQHCDAVLILREGSVSYYGDPNDDSINESLFDSNDGKGNNIDQFMIRKHSVAEVDKKVDFGHFSMPPLQEIKEENEMNFISTIPFDTISKSSFAIDEEQSPVVQDYSKRTVKAVQEERSEGGISYKTYHKYFNAGGGVFYTFGMFFIFILAEVAAIISDWWIASWCRWCASSSSNYYINSTIDINTCSAGCENITNPLSVPVCIGIYGGLVGSVWILAIARTVLFYIILLRASTLSHNKMFISVLRSPVLFFDTNPVGRILNRFSKDIGFLDDILIHTFCNSLQFFTRFLAVVVTASIANYYLVIVVFVMMIFFTIFRWYYLKSAREIKRLESVARSPLYSHISMTLQGLPTIRAYGKQNDSLDKFYEYQNKHTQAWYLYIISARWFGIRIDMICTAFVSIFAFSAISLAQSLDASIVGLSLTYAITAVGVFQFCVILSAEVESLMVSAERVMTYGELSSEGALESHSIDTPTDWPNNGQIEITDLSYRHSTDGPFVLQGINCCIASGEKVGIVGRTGAGKSSLIASFFRLAEPSGSIRIDGIECFNIGLHDLRPNISIIPQDPVLFSGTVRYNLDPFNQYDDEKIWTSLKHVQLDSVIESLDGGLGTLVSEGGSNFSVGQKQLFCLARALLKQNKILMLDEATANVDLKTDSIIQKVIREQFVDCTVLTIAHRLDTVMDSDRIMVLRNGKLLEYGEPYELLCNSESYLLKLVKQTGPVAAEKLKNMALNVYNRKHLGTVV